MKKKQPVALQNLETDIGEKVDVLKRNPDVVKELLLHAKVFQQELAKNSRPALLMIPNHLWN